MIEGVRKNYYPDNSEDAIVMLKIKCKERYEKKTVIIAILIILLMSAVPVYASTANSQATTVTVDAAQTNNTDITGVLNYLDIKGTQEGNVFAFTSKSASVTGKVDGLFANASNSKRLAESLQKTYSRSRLQ
jgi:hypothetical protein